MKNICLLACWLALGAAACEMACGTAWGMEEPVVGKAVVELKFDKAQYYFGEPVQVEFVLRNTDEKEIAYNSGGDYRGVNRHLRFRVQAVNADGEIVPLADPDMSHGGLGQTPTLKPGEEWRETLWPLDYLRLTKPGKYTVRITHDLGWMEPYYEMARRDQTDFIPKDWNAPIGETGVEFLMPDAQKAEQIVEKIAAELKGDDRRDDEKKEVPSASDLAFPIYLPLLKKHALNGESFFLTSIGEMPTHEATQTLLELAEKKDFPDANAAAYWLSLRMPQRKTKRPDWMHEKRQRLFEAAWDESYVPRARAIARALVESFDPQKSAQQARVILSSGCFLNMTLAFRDVDLGAQILASVGTAEDYKTLQNTLKKATYLTAKPRRGIDASILHFPAPIPELLATLEVLRERGAPMFQDGDFGLYLKWHEMANTPGPRSPEWLKEVTAFADSRYPVQLGILESIPNPVPPECRDLVRRLLNAEDYGVLMQACYAVGSLGDKTLLPEVLEIIQAENHDFLFNAAISTASQLGARRELVEALVGRLADEKLCSPAMRALMEISMEKKDLSSSWTTSSTRQKRITLQDAWRKWITEHGAELDAGTKFTPDQIPKEPAAAE